MNEVGILIRVRETASAIFAKIGDAAKTAAQKIGEFATARPSLTGLTAAARNLASAIGGPLVGAFARAGSAALNFGKQLFTVQGFARIVGGALKTVLLGGLGAIAGIAFGAVRGLTAMRAALEKTGAAGAGAGASLRDAGDDAQSAAADIGNASALTEAAAAKAQVAFGAFGDVGAGFIMRQGSVTEGAAQNAESALDVADRAARALGDTRDSFGDSTTAATRFGAVMDRLGVVFDGVKNKLLGAIAKAITPALEALATLMESPEFQNFVTLLAEDLADAIVTVATWFVNTALPALDAFIGKVNEVGGPVEWIKQKFNELRDTFLMVIAIIVYNVYALSEKLNELRNAALQGVINKLNEWKSSLKSFFAEIATGLSNLLNLVSTKVSKIAEIIKAMIEESLKGMGNVIILKLNRLFRNINEFLSYVNTILEKAGIAKIQLIPEIPALAEGGVVTRATLARVGEGGQPEAVVPLDRISEFVGKVAGGGVTINVSVPAGTPNPTTFGTAVGGSIVAELRRRGQSLPALG